MTATVQQQEAELTELQRIVEENKATIAALEAATAADVAGLQEQLRGMEAAMAELQATHVQEAEQAERALLQMQEQAAQQKAEAEEEKHQLEERLAAEARLFSGQCFG